MPIKKELIENIAGSMMKGPRQGRIKATQRQKENFQLRHEKQIKWAIEKLPRCSVSVYAVVVKCLIRYEYNQVIRFCNALKIGLFSGTKDPALLLWKYLQKNDKDPLEVYQKTVCAAKAYMEGRDLLSLRPVKDDILEWDESFTVPDEFLKNWKPDITPGEDLIETSTTQTV